ncbi:MAG: hypothetical protein J6B48_01240 [Clostridia bacterium]|nr:hypothetical protein [Clostridia bacterium]
MEEIGERQRDKLTEGQKAKMRCVGSYDASMERYLATKPMFNGYEKFWSI